MSKIGLHYIDIIVILTYIVGIVWYGVRMGKQTGAEEYFLGGRSMTWPIIGVSLFAANIGSNTLIGLSSDAFQGNVAVYNYEWTAAITLVFFAVFFLPFYLKSKVYTMPEFLERRYDSRSRYIFSVVMILGNVLIDMASGLYAGNLILKIVLPEVDSTIIIALLALSAAIYTIPGGLSSVIHTEVLQAVLLVTGSCIVTWVCFQEVGGWSGMITGLDSLYATGSIERQSDDIFSLVRPSDDPSMPWTGLLFGVPLLSFYFWVNNQFIVQRVLSAKDLNHGRWGVLFAGLLKLPVLFIMVIPGVIATVLFSDLNISFLNYQISSTLDTTVTCERLRDCPNMTFPVLMYKLLPTGLLGLVIAGVLAAMASSIAATLNSASTLITMDFVSKAKPNISNKGQVRVGKITTFILVILAAAWAPQIENFSSLWEYLQATLAYISPPIAAAFLVGLFYKNSNADGAFWSFIIGYTCSLLFLLCKSLGMLPQITDIHFLLQVPVIFLICVGTNVIVSKLGLVPNEVTLKNYVWSIDMYQQESLELARIPWYQNYRKLSLILVSITASMVIWFW